MYMKRLHLIIKGRVQGVFYRHNTKKKAIELNLKGYVKNLDNSNVEVIVEGQENNLKIFLDWCWQGSSFSKVENIEIKWENSKDEYSEFTVNY